MFHVGKFKLDIDCFEPTFSHYLLTRFNLKTTWTEDRVGNPVQTHAWLQRRLELFSLYCLPSVQQQTCQDFIWLVIIDNASPDAFVNELKNLLKGFDHFKILATTEQRVLVDVRRIIIDDSKGDTVITSRLDNDDILHRGYIKTVQDIASTLRTDLATVIDLPRGYQLVLDKDDKTCLLELDDSYNAFISLVEPFYCLQTVWSRKHTAWRGYAPVATDLSDRYWVQVIHDGNIANRKITHLRMVRNVNTKDFALANMTLRYNVVHQCLRPVYYLFEVFKVRLYKYLASE